MKKIIARALEENMLALITSFNEENISKLGICAKKIAKAIENDGTIFAFGNGGSASDAQHFVAELIGKFEAKRKAYAAICLSSNISAITAIANDFSFEEIFSRQVDALVKKNDVVIGISTSGISANVIKGLKKAKEKGAYTIALTSHGGKKNLSKVSDIIIEVYAKRTPRIQELHLLLLHVLCELVEYELCKRQLKN
ncbi:MAG: SIS domain-containing protein [Candidatus Diapherotrites archaeon]